MYQIAARQAKHGSVPWYRWLKWGDWLIYGLIGSLAVLFFFLSAGQMPAGSVRAVLSQRGETLLVVTSEQLQQGGSVEFDADGFHYRLEYRDNRIRFAEADCPDRICVQSGWISRPGQIAACVPGHLILKIEATGQLPTDPDDVDVIIG